MSGWVKIHQIPQLIFEPQVSFYLIFGSLFSVMRNNCSVPLQRKLIWFGQKELIKVQNFSLSTAHMKFHQIYTLIGSFCWKYIKFQLKGYRGVTSHYTEEWSKFWRKTDFCFKNDKNLVHFDSTQVSKICTLICPFCAKYITFDLKKDRGVIFHDNKVLCKLWRKTDLWFEKWHDEFGKFSPKYL